MVLVCMEDNRKMSFAGRTNVHTVQLKGLHGWRFLVKLNRGALSTLVMHDISQQVQIQLLSAGISEITTFNTC